MAHNSFGAFALCFTLELHNHQVASRSIISVLSPITFLAAFSVSPVLGPQAALGQKHHLLYPVKNLTHFANNDEFQWKFCTCKSYGITYNLTNFSEKIRSLFQGNLAWNSYQQSTEMVLAVGTHGPASALFHKLSAVITKTRQVFLQQDLLPGTLYCEWQRGNSWCKTEKRLKGDRLGRKGTPPEHVQVGSKVAALFLPENEFSSSFVFCQSRCSLKSKQLVLIKKKCYFSNIYLQASPMWKIPAT